MNQSQMNSQNKVPNLSEGLHAGDLSDAINRIFTVDQYQSKMGNDEDTIVLKFHAFNKEPAIDLMEFIEKGYAFVLDSDISSGEEKNGAYSVFVEIERNDDADKHVSELLNGISELCDIDNWRFRWYKDAVGHDFDRETFAKYVPLTPEKYNTATKNSDVSEIGEFFNQGAIDSVEIDENRNISFNKPYAGRLTANVVAIGEYAILKNELSGAIQLDEQSQNQVLYLNKYLGNYEIHKIEDHFLIRNGEKAVIITKNTW